MLSCCCIAFYKSRLKMVIKVYQKLRYTHAKIFCSGGPFLRDWLERRQPPVKSFTNFTENTQVRFVHL